MSNLKRKIICGLLIIFFFTSVFASPIKEILQSKNICQSTDTVFGFFNGVQTTKVQADLALEKFAYLHGAKLNDVEDISYELFYNHTNGFEDFVETFEQRMLEHDKILEGRFELFFGALNGNKHWWEKIIEAVSSTKDILVGFVDWVEAATIRNLTVLIGNPPTYENYVEHRARIDNLAVEGKKLLFVAHSQGNLFVNAAYDYARTKVPGESVKVVHIAPASPLLNGGHTLADLDLVINGLRIVGNVVKITDYIPNYFNRPPGLNGEKDILGHGLLEIYLNQKLDISRTVKDQINTALNSLVAPPRQASAGFFTATLTWDGSGDVDLHVFEPDNSHVYYSRRHGKSGYLDVDNTHANGPEHYFASCDLTELQTGSYRVAVANFSLAEGRTATVQIASANEGVLGTKSVVLGPATSSNPSYSLFDVFVGRSEQTGNYSVSIDH